jgi:hypothetical protein
MDVLPTVAVAAAGYSEQELKQQYHIEGTDLTPYITGKKTEMPHDEMFWPYLYNIRQDGKETHNLINKDSLKSTLQDMKAKLDKWNKENPVKY